VPKQAMLDKIGRYTIVRELGKGAMGIVYEGVDPTINRRVAIKTARRDVMESSGRAEEMMERFLREATAAGGLNHPNIITIYDAGEEADMAYIAMEYLEGGDLFDVIEEKKRFSPEEAVETGTAILDALAVAHDNGIVHRDIKPANILTPRGGSLKVADFGIARIENSNLTQEGAMIGTPHYMSPEQFMGHKVDARSDLFSVGIILYEMLTGEKPFGGEALSTVMHNVIKTDPVNPSELNFAVSTCLSRVVLKSLAKRPNDRYPSARAMAAALHESIKDNPDPAITLVDVDDATTTIVSRTSADASTIVSTALPAGGKAAPKHRATVDQQGRDQAAGGGRKLPVPVIVVGGIVVVLIVMLTVFFVAGGRDQLPTPDQPRGATASGTFFKGAMVKLYYADSDTAYDLAEDAISKAEASGASPDFSGIPGVEFGSGTVTLRDPTSGAEREVKVVRGSKHDDFRGEQWSQIEAHVDAGAEYGTDRAMYLASEANEMAYVTFVMKRQVP